MDTKKVKKVLKKGMGEVQKKSVNMEAAALKEFGKMKAKMEGISKKVESYVKKNPEKAVLISTGIAAALAGIAVLAASKKSAKKSVKNKK